MSIYTHKHHIVPRHAGGTDDPSNLVELTIEEHSEAHRKLYEEYGRWQDRIAWKALSGQIEGEEARRIARDKGRKDRWSNPEQIENMRRRFTGEKNPFFGKHHTEETRKSMSKSREGNQNGAKHYIVTDPDGTEYEVYNLAEFCKGREINCMNMGAVARGVNRHHKGWQCKFL